MSLLDQIAAIGKRPEIVLDRSELELYLRCPLWCKQNRESPIDDFDADRMKFVGIAFHAVMAEAIRCALEDGANFAEALKGEAAGAPAHYQPDLNHLAGITALKFRPKRFNYISHERQYAYRLPQFGPKGEDLILTCRPDYVAHDEECEGLYLPDWKTGWGTEGFNFQAMFYSVVMWRSHENIKRATWQPLFCRRGAWGKRQVFDEPELEQAEIALKRAAMDYLSEDSWLPTPGSQRCRICPYVEKCDAHQRFGDIDKNPEAFLLGYMKLKEELGARAAALTAKVGKTGPISTDGHWWGASPFSSRVSFRLNKGAPDFMDDSEDNDAETSKPKEG